MRFGGPSSCWRDRRSPPEFVSYLLCSWPMGTIVVATVTLHHDLAVLVVHARRGQQAPAAPVLGQLVPARDTTAPQDGPKPAHTSHHTASSARAHIQRDGNGFPCFYRSFFFLGGNQIPDILLFQQPQGSQGNLNFGSGKTPLSTSTFLQSTWFFGGDLS